MAMGYSPNFSLFPYTFNMILIEVFILGIQKEGMLQGSYKFYFSTCREESVIIY